MRLKTLTLKNYRNFSDQHLEFDPDFNLFYGQNGQGKTNLLEAIWLLCGAKSFRPGSAESFVRFGEEGYSLESNFFSGERDQTSVIRWYDGKKKILRNDVELTSPAQLCESFYCVVFHPSVCEIVSGAPADRRRFLDTAITCIYPAYYRICSDYAKLVANRNRILRDLSYQSSLLDLLEEYDVALASAAVQMTRYRASYCARLSEKAAGFYRGISFEKEPLSLSYQTSIPGFEALAAENPREAAEEFVRLLRSRRKEEVEQKTTLQGPHRDDLSLSIFDRNAREFGSVGQQRSIVIALKLAEAEILEEKRGEPPVILLDDVLSELDRERQGYLLDRFSGNQIFVTCCDIDPFSRMSRGRAFEIKGGRVNRESSF